MHISRWLTAILLAISCIALPTQSYAAVFVGISIDTPPPVLPIYSQPPAPGANFIWMPGYWASGPYGYFWVPGTWVRPPQLGMLWTPGFWGWNPQGYYAWHPGYWARRVGFYGGINYGFGYFGRGYVGGGWFGNIFRYNTAVTNVNTTIIKNVYIDKTVVINNTTINRVSYNGGTGGIVATPNTDELAVQHEPHFAMTPEQRSHVQTASSDREFSAAVNHGQPVQTTTAQPLSRQNVPTAAAPARPQDDAIRPALTARQPVKAPQQPARQVVSRRAPAPRRPATPHQQRKVTRASAIHRNR